VRLVRMGAAGSRNIAATVLRSAGGGRGCREEQRGYRDGYVDAAHPLAEGPRCRGPSGRPKDARGVHARSPLLRRSLRPRRTRGHGVVVRSSLSL
jgi:hypothetical protein